MIKAIWAMTKEGVVGQDNTIPWHIKDEFKHFRSTTLNQDVIMGKNTYLSLPKNFDKRNIFVLSDDPNWKPDNENITVLNSYENLIKDYNNNPDKDLYVMGGIYVYKQMIPLCDELIVSIIKHNYSGNRVLDNIDFSNFEIYKTDEHEEFIVQYYKKIIKN